MALAEDRAALMGANEALGEALASNAAELAALETATGQAASAIQDYDNAEPVEATGLIAEASEGAHAVSQQIAAAQQRLESYIARMS